MDNEVKPLNKELLILNNNLKVKQFKLDAVEPDRKGVIVYFSHQEHKLNFKTLTQKIENLQNDVWRILIHSHSRPFSQKLIDWQRGRGDNVYNDLA